MFFLNTVEKKNKGQNVFFWNTTTHSESLYFSGVPHMRPSAEVNEGPAPVDGGGGGGDFFFEDAHLRKYIRYQYSLINQV